MENEKHAFRIRTVKASPFRILIEALKEILTEANLEIDPHGLKIIAMDGTQTVLVHLRLHSEWFEEFYCPQRLILGLNMINFFKAMIFCNGISPFFNCTAFNLNCLTAACTK